MIKGTIRVHTIPTDKPLNTQNIARVIAQQIRKGTSNHVNDRQTEIRRSA